MSKRAEPPTIDMAPGTAAALRERGGHLYVWADGAGMPRASINPPAQRISYDTTTVADSCLVHVDSGIKPPHAWVIKCRRLPWPHFVALYDPPELRWTRPSLRDFLSGLCDGFVNGPLP